MPPQHRFDTPKVGKGKRHKNVSLNAETEVSIRIRAFTVNRKLSKLPPNDEVGEPEFLAIDNPVIDHVECVVDTGAMMSIFNGVLAKQLGLDPNAGEIDNEPILVCGDMEVECCRCIHEIYLEIGPYPIPVRVGFPVEPVQRGTAVEYQWIDDFSAVNLLGMESVLNKRLLCFTPEYLYAFENRP